VPLIGARATTWPVAGSTTSLVAAASLSTKEPPMKLRSVRGLVTDVLQIGVR
jgi:hypothetical protein